MTRVQHSLAEYQARVNDLVVHLSNDCSALSIPPGIGRVLDQVVLAMMRPHHENGDVMIRRIIENLFQALLIAGQLGINVEQELDAYLAELERYTIIGS